MRTKARRAAMVAVATPITIASVARLLAGCGTSSRADAGDGGPAVSAAPVPLSDLCPLFTEDLCIYLPVCAASLRAAG